MSSEKQDADAGSPYAEQIERFGTLFANSPNFAAVLVGPDHRFLLANPAYERLVSGRPIIGLTAAEALPEAAEQGFITVLDRVFETGEPYVGRDVAISLSLEGEGGLEERRLDFVYQPVRSPSGRVVAIFVEGTDATERFASAEALRAGEQRNRQILDSAVDHAIIATDLDGRVTRWSRGAEHILGWIEQEMLGQLTDRIFTPEDRADGRPAVEMAAALKTGRGIDERWHVRRSGERFWASGEMTPLLDAVGNATGFVKVLRDRTDEHRVSEALRASEERLRRAQEAGGVGVFAVDIAASTLQPSPEFCRIFGMQPCARLSASEIEALVLPEDHAAASDDARRRTGEMPLASEYRIRRASDGEVRTIFRRAELERDEQGRPTRMLGVVQDVTEQRKSQAAVVASEARFRAFTEAVPNQVWSADENGRLDWANQRTYDYGGQNDARIVPKGWERLVHPDDLAPAAEAWSRALATGDPYEAEFRLRRSDGTYRWHIARAVALKDAGGSVERWIGTNTDIEDERRARNELAELNATLERRVEERTRERQLLARIVETTDDQIEALDLQYRWLAINASCADAYERIYGVRPKVGQSLLEVLADRPEHREAVREVWARAIAGESFGLTAEWGDPAFGRRVFENRFEILRGLDGAQIGAFATGRDVTERLREQRRLALAEEQLRQAQKMEAVGQLTGGVAHDFNNLLTVIRGSVDLLRSANITSERRDRYVDAIGATADRAAKLTGQLLAFARRQTLKPELFDAGKSVQEVSGMINTLTGSRIALDVRLFPEACLILADRSQFDTTIVNLGINARDAMQGEGALTITIDAVDGIPPLRGHAAVSGDFVAIRVADSGTGIEPTVLERIFEPFFTTKGVGEGTGLGLSQVIGFAKQSGGDIQVESELGVGTEFTLYLPRAPEQAPVQEVRGDEGTISGEGMCVLIVEDNERVGEFAQSALQELGYDTALATDASAALRRLEQGDGRFHIVFSDVVMPGMSGIELADEIRQLYPDVAVVLTSGYSHVLAKNGTHGFELLHKPYSIEQLSRVLHKAANWHRRGGDRGE